MIKTAVEHIFAVIILFLLSALLFGDYHSALSVLVGYAGAIGVTHFRDNKSK